MGVLTDQLVDVSARLASRAAAEQGGVLSGSNPSAYNPSDPIRLWVIQVVIIIAMTQFLSLGLSRIRQPRVIAEVIGGVLLGPSVMGHIPGFTTAIFPAAGMPLLTLTSTIGLVLFLFLVGLEIDVRVIKRNVRASVLISVAGLVVPLGLGAALGVGIYRQFIDQSVNFGYFLLFTAVAVGITAFPVLCRILTELKLLDTTVGVVVLSAGVGNDVVGWILLALTVALVNASTGLTALYVLLASVGFVVFLMYPIRWCYMWLARRTGSLEQGSPTTLMMTITLIMILGSAFFTDIIGVHPIFGGFLAGLVIPHENGFAISLVEKLEDLVSILFLPIYFTLSGLNTNLGLLDDGITWAYIILICLVAFTSKFVACGVTAYYTGFNWREAGAIGSLMSCKGLVELIVLNIGLNANILNPRTFSMFVLHALILTFITTPLTLLFYPAKHRVHDGTTTAKIGGGDREAGGRRSTSEDEVKTKFSIVLDKIEQLPAAMTLSQLLQTPGSPSSSFVSLSAEEKALEALPTLTPSPLQARVSIDALRLIELSNRTSAVLKSQEADVLLHNDPIVSVFRTFGHLNRLVVSAALSVVGYDEFPDAIAQHALEFESQMVILPWSRGATSVLAEEEDPGRTTGARNPFDGIFHKTATQDQTSSVVYSEFIRKVFLHSPTDVALFVDRGLSLTGAAEQRLFLPFVGGPDDRLALAFLVQLSANPGVRATVVWICKVESTADEKEKEGGLSARHAGTTHLTMAAPDTVYGAHSTQTRLVSDTADNLLWDRFALPSSAHAPGVAAALSRVTFAKQAAAAPLHRIVELVELESAKLAAGQNLMVLLGRSRRMAVESHKAELQQLISGKGTSIGSAVSKTVGDVGAALVASGTGASLLVLQAAVPPS
ncbi:Sodium/hydrogen exchanger family-domain-containing protein [Mycena belliarum]|uniref:Sodium/hydrogen exchanger family-domain-containing protein n=1 Tax=Mycena belliarum TaxID=1033014 RepID=A0AAD6XTL8_9AGAR|nr:Sodium/hydrogen exchanger family-domain-containing protein [Mycena belliae]